LHDGIVHTRNVHFVRHIPPTIDCGDDLLHNLSSLAIVQSIKHGSIEGSFQVGAIV